MMTHFNSVSCAYLYRRVFETPFSPVSHFSQPSPSNLFSALSSPSVSLQEQQGG